MNNKLSNHYKEFQMDIKIQCQNHYKNHAVQ